MNADIMKDYLRPKIKEWSDMTNRNGGHIIKNGQNPNEKMVLNHQCARVVALRNKSNSSIVVICAARRNTSQKVSHDEIEKAIFHRSLILSPDRKLYLENFFGQILEQENNWHPISSPMTKNIAFEKKLDEKGTEKMNSPIKNLSMKKFVHQLDKEKRRLKRIHKTELEQYSGKFIAFMNGEIIDSDPDIQILAKRVYEIHGRNQPILIKKLETKKRKRLMTRPFLRKKHGK